MVMTPRPGLPVLVPLLVPVLLLLAACGQGTSGVGGSEDAAPAPDASSPAGLPDGASTAPSGAPSTVPSGPAAGGTTLPADPAGADLVLVAGPPGAQQPPVTLACDWAGGTTGGSHPQAAQACADLLAALSAGDPFAPVAPDAMCTQQYGGDAVVEVSGTVLAADGAPVDVAGTYTLTDGCQIGRFEAMGAVLAPFRGTV